MTLWVLVPSRGRPENVARLVKACALTCQADTRLHFGFDDDDPHLHANCAAAGGHRYTVGPRTGLAAWTNDLVRRHIRRGDAAALGSLGDDHLPVTNGWDAALLGELERIGSGFAYPNDQRRDDIPEAVVISAPIVAELGWMCQPSLHHWYVDNVWRDLGAAAGCLSYCGDVIVRHLHPQVTGQPGDVTYGDAAEHFHSDLAGYQRWRLRDMPGDVAVVRRVRAAAQHPV